jgi:hypothetical protein
MTSILGLTGRKKRKLKELSYKLAYALFTIQALTEELGKIKAERDEAVQRASYLGKQLETQHIPPVGLPEEADTAWYQYKRGLIDRKQLDEILRQVEFDQELYISG